MSSLSFPNEVSMAGEDIEKLNNVANGNLAQDELDDLLFAEWQAGSLSSYVRRFRLGIKGYSNSSQFYAAFMVQFENRERWILFSTTSCRGDRLKEQQWDADNLKKLDTSISKAYLVYPDRAEAKEIAAFKSMSARYESHQDYSRVDAIVTQSELVALVRAHADELKRPSAEELSEFTPAVEPAVAMTATDVGRLLDFNGKQFERDVAMLLADPWNLQKWNAAGEVGRGGVNYGAFAKAMRLFGFDSGAVASVQTKLGKDLGTLPSGGPPKTDVLAIFSLRDGSEVRKTISCKRTSDSNVTAHQYKAETFALVLDPTDAELRRVLEVCQSVGCAQEQMSDADCDTMCARLAPHRRRLAEWVVEGTGGGGTPDQLAKYLFSFDEKTEEFCACRTSDYVDALLNRKLRKRNGRVCGFGTPFSWTYQGERGDSIQLKMPVLKCDQ